MLKFQAMQNNRISVLYNGTISLSQVKFEAYIEDVTSSHDRLMNSLLVGPNRVKFQKVGSGAKMFENHCITASNPETHMVKYIS